MDKDISTTNETKLFIPETLIGNTEFSNYTLAVYCVLYILSASTHIPIQCVTYQQIVFYLTGQVRQKRNRIYDYVKCGLNELLDNDIVIKNDEFNKHLVLDCSNMWLDTKNKKFVVITFDEMKKIFEVENVNNFLLLKYFVLVIWTISSKITVYLENGTHKKRVLGKYTIDTLSKMSGISTRSIIEYNKILEDIELLYVFRSEDFTINKENNDIRRLNNIYGRPCDKEYIDTFGYNQKKYHQSHYYIESNIETANNKRRLAQMYQQLLKGGGNDYTEKEIMDVYEYVISENEKFERMYEKNNYDSYLEKIRDTEIFEKFDFIKEK